MKTNTLHFTIGPMIGEQILNIAQENIFKGHINKGIDTYIEAFPGFTKEYAMMCLKNQAVIVTNKDNITVSLSDDTKTRLNNAKNIYDWETIILNKITNIYTICADIHETARLFMGVYNGDIENYNIIDMMLRYFNTAELRTINTHNIVAKIIGTENCKCKDKNLNSIWSDLEDEIENNSNNSVNKWEMVLYYTVKYNKLIRTLYKEYSDFEKLYWFLSENKFIKKPKSFSCFLEMVFEILFKFTNTSKGYYHPYCNTNLYTYKTKLLSKLSKLHYGKIYFNDGIFESDIMDKYDAGWLSPEGEFYGANGNDNLLLHMRLAEKIYNTQKYHKLMTDDGVSDHIVNMNSPEHWLETHNWVKIHHNDCYGYFDGGCPTDIQIKIICDYADKFYNGKFYTEPNALGRVRHTEPYSTYAVRQMDKIRLHEIFR